MHVVYIIHHRKPNQDTKSGTSQKKKKLVLFTNLKHLCKSQKLSFFVYLLCLFFFFCFFVFFLFCFLFCFFYFFIIIAKKNLSLSKYILLSLYHPSPPSFILTVPLDPFLQCTLTLARDKFVLFRP